ncbi:MAG: beta-glucosidase [Subdoligranulum variabile]|nr:MAG: beta-glucosidase [Subdoligranulum variabile]
MAQEKKHSGNTVKTVKTAISGVLCVALAAGIVAANVLIPPNASSVQSVLGLQSPGIDNSKANTEGVDLNYSKPGFDTEEALVENEIALNKQIAGEGIVLLKNDANSMPYSTDTTFSFVSHSSVAYIGGAKGDLKTAFEDRGFGVNNTLWDFYSTGNGKDYVRGVGSVNFGDDEDFAINECPLSVMQSEAGLLDSMEGTVPVFVFSRIVGEGRDMPRSMYNHTDIEADKSKTYLEPDSVELEILQYLNDNFDDVVLLVNSGAAVDLSWVSQFPNIHTIVSAPSMGDYGLYSLADIFAGTINPSGRTVDTYEADPLSSPAAQNFGDFSYYTEDGEQTKYNYVSYKEGIYVGYRYYETRYEDVVLGQGNAGNYSYTDSVVYPFGYGLSYTTFEWSDYKTSWDGTTCTVSVNVKNTGSRAGKDVVEIFAQSPYTDYDKTNQVEKSAVELVGYAKTSELAPGASETITVTFDQEQLKSYDYINAKTYILDAGTYYITAAKNAHDAVNNILAAKGKTVEDGMTAEGNPEMVNTYVPTNGTVDSTTYASDTTTGVTVTNLFDHANGGLQYLSRSDWQGTWPTTDGQVSNQISTWGNPINGTDANGQPVSYQWYKTISAEDLAQMDSFDSLNPTDPATLTDTPTYGVDNGLGLIDMRGLAYDDPQWDLLLDQLTPADYQTLITQSGYGTAAIKSVDKPSTTERDAATGLVNYGMDASGNFTFKSNITHAGVVVLAQTYNDELALHYGENIGDESYYLDVDGWYAPAVNTHRTPFSGRNAEYYSEDPFLAGRMASLEVQGVASRGMYVFVKHFAINDQENHRGDRDGQYSIATFLNEQAAREIYLKPFEMAVKSGTVEMSYAKDNGDGTYSNATTQIPACTGVMTSFNRIGYTWAGGNYNLITGLLRGEWGFHGFIITDNANTGVFMDAGQMIQAGADGKLTNLPTGARYTFDENNVSDYHYGREAIHNILYTVANSKAMNGGMPGSQYLASIEPYQMVIYVIDGVCGVIIALLVVLTILRYRKKKNTAV